MHAMSVDTIVRLPLSKEAIRTLYLGSQSASKEPRGHLKLKDFLQATPSICVTRTASIYFRGSGKSRSPLLRIIVLSSDNEDILLPSRRKND